MPRSPALPVLGLLLAATLWGLVWYPLRLLEESGMPGVWATLVAYGAALLPGAFLVGRRLREFTLHPWQLIALGLASGWTNLAFIVAVLEGTVVRVVLLFYLSPLWTVVLGRIVLKEKIDLAAAIVLLLAMTGAIIMLWVPELGVPWPQDFADWMAISSGIAFSLTNVLVRGLQGISIPVKSMANWIGGVAIAGGWILIAGLATPTSTAPIWLSSALLGVFGFVVMTITVQYGVTHMPLHRSAVILLFELVVATVSAQLLANEFLAVREWIGGALIVAAAVVSAVSHRKNGRR